MIKGSPFTNCHLDRETMFQIAVDIAQVLEYLHGGYNTRILHFNMKPHNILLDEDLCPKISNFGLAKLCNTNDCVVSMADMRRIVGYIVPVVFSGCFGVSHNFDVYNYGMLVLKMVGGKEKF
jgi:serine/threonine protein kinase